MIYLVILKNVTSEIVSFAIKSIIWIMSLKVRFRCEIEFKNLSTVIHGFTIFWASLMRGSIITLRGIEGIFKNRFSKLTNKNDLKSALLKFSTKMIARLDDQTCVLLLIENGSMIVFLEGEKLQK